MNCPKCNSPNIVKNVSIHNEKRKFKCKDCGRQFIENSAKKRVDEKTKYLIDKLLGSGLKPLISVQKPLEW